MKRFEIRKLIEQEIAKIKTVRVENTVDKATVTDNARLADIMTSLGNRASGAYEKRKVVSQVILALASALEITPSEVLRAYMDYKKDAAGNASTDVKEK